MHQPDSTPCPPWCVADHAAEDGRGRRRHRGATVTVPGIALRSAPPHDVHGVELLIELHAENPDFATIVVEPGEPFEIEGLAVGLIRNTMLM